MLPNYGEIFDKQEYRELAVLQIVNFLSYGMDGKTGLPYHGYDMTDSCKYGIIGWGRAVGWLLRGMMGCTRALIHPPFPDRPLQGVSPRRQCLFIFLTREDAKRHPLF